MASVRNPCTHNLPPCVFGSARGWSGAVGAGALAPALAELGPGQPRDQDRLDSPYSQKTCSWTRCPHCSSLGDWIPLLLRGLWKRAHHLWSWQPPRPQRELQVFRSVTPTLFPNLMDPRVGPSTLRPWQKIMATSAVDLLSTTSSPHCFSCCLWSRQPASVAHTLRWSSAPAEQIV